ncbi:MAG TPA: SLAC1 anion channel family protein [Oxalicibacterium sp.]|uniref:SLAC1 anion channel family protein n=1 Tax=Oxalicibacterium sp. TaxID=2766525 RepID=UPI002CEFF79F|nr:SLAC1 anion channel family protein [Oxalicibacterium sp.]HWU98144.1 SLAC1 anion channel family protein [Oxalicibacterium sp.]
MNTTTIESSPTRKRLGYLPVALFGSVMGLTGLSVAWRFAHAQYGTPLWIAHAIGILAVLAFIAQSTGYAIKAFTDFAAVRAEFEHPVAGNLFGTPLVSLLLLPLLLADINLTFARIVWTIGAVLMTIFAWTIVSRWITTKQKIAHATPAWIVPAVGLIDIPLAIPALGWQTELHSVMLFATAVGLFFAIPLFTLILARLMYEDPLPSAMQPSLLILGAPFAVGFAAYVATTGTIDFFAEALYMLMLFMTAVLLGRLRHLPRCCPFRVGWWAASFPLAATAATALRYAAHADNLATDVIAGVLLGIATVVILGLAWRTVTGIAKGELQTLTT